MALRISLSQGCNAASRYFHENFMRWPLHHRTLSADSVIYLMSKNVLFCSFWKAFAKKRISTLDRATTRRMSKGGGMESGLRSTLEDGKDQSGKIHFLFLSHCGISILPAIDLPSM